MSEPQVLEGVRVLDLTTIVSGGTATALLADFGADVIKVEQPGTGDPLRAWGPIKEGQSLWWKVLSRSKRSVTLNLRDPRGQQMLKELAARSDILVENFRPGTLERWNLGHDVLDAANPGLVMVRISGFGQTGPYRDRPGFGTVAEAMSGYVFVSGMPGGPPLLPPIPLADEVAGLFGALAGLMALRYRDRTGRGQVVDVSLYEPLFRLLIPHIPQYALMGRRPEGIGNRFPDAAPRNLYRTSDGEWIALSASTQRVFDRLAHAMGRDDLLADPRFADNKSRVANVDALDEIIQHWMEQRTLDAALESLEHAEAVAGPIYDAARILGDSQYAARENVLTIEDLDLGSVPMPGIVPRLSVTPGRVTHAGPRLGEHNRQVYGELLGLDDDGIAQLAAEGVI